MAGEKKIDNAEPISAVLKPDSVTGLAKQEVVQVSGKDGVPSDLTSSKPGPTDFISGKKGDVDQGIVGEHGVSYAPTYNYYYPGYNGSYAQLDDLSYFPANGSNTGVQSEDGSMYYYCTSSYPPYAPGAIMGVDGQGIGQQQYYPTSGYPQQPVSYGSDAMSCYSWDPAMYRDVSNGTNGSYLNPKSGSGPGLAKSNVFNSTKTNGSLNAKFSKPLHNTQPVKTVNKMPHLGSDFSANAFLKGYSQVGRLPAFTSPKQGLYPHSGFPTYRPTYSGRVWNPNPNDRFKPKDKSNRIGDFEASAELTRGPRSRKGLSDSPAVKEELGLFPVRREQYNLPDFQIDYENAKFYVIKSYSEDDIHKSIKYSVWASTPNGNKKLDGTFREVDNKSVETGTNCPVFLFFSVNGSGQFVGVAEMIGQVDFNKDMEFWQVDKWNGFFPVKWHIVKDVPNTQLRHIILENNENKSVTCSRDTQEIGLKQGLEMLNIFKSYTEKTTLFEDFGFYDNREKALLTKRSMKPATLKMDSIYKDSDFAKLDKKVEIESEHVPASLISMTENLSLNSAV